MGLNLAWGKLLQAKFKPVIEVFDINRRRNYDMFNLMNYSLPITVIVISGTTGVCGE